MTTFPTRILLVTDGSPHAENARLAAADISVKGGAALHLVHPWHRATGPLTLPEDTSQVTVSGMLAHERDLLASAGARIATTHAPEGGWPAERIASVARGVGADLILIGSHGLGRIHRAISTTTADALLRLSTIPLLVVRDDPGAWPPARILAADDGSAVARDAAVLAADLGRSLGCPVEAVQVLDPDNTVRKGATTGLREAASGGDAPAILAVGHRFPRRHGDEPSHSVTERLLAEGSTSLLICPSGALRRTRRLVGAAKARR